MGLVTVSAADNFAVADAAIGGNPGKFVIAPKFPLTLAATEDLLNWSNAFPSQPTPTLSVSVGPTDTSISLTAGNGAQLPLDTFRVSIDDEILFILARSGDVLTVGMRGAERSTSAAHTVGASVQLQVTADSHNQVVAEVVEIEHLLGPSGVHVFPSSIALTPGLGGNFTVAHGLGVVPRLVLIQMTSGGAIWFQAGTPYDGTNINLVASDAGVTGFAKVWA